MIRGRISSFGVWLLFICWAVINQINCLGATLPFELEADHINLSNNQSQLDASGNVIVKYKTYIIQSENIHHNKKENIIIFENNVKLSNQNGNSLNASKFELNLINDTGTITNGKIKTIHNHFIKAKKIQLTDSTIELTESSVTTCSLDHPHYFLSSEKALIYRNNQTIQAKANRLLFYGIPIFYFPMFSQNINDAKENRSSPKFGYNQIDGTYGILNTGYFINPKSTGQISLGTSYKRGFRYGLNHTFTPEHNHSITFSSHKVAKTGFEGGASYKWTKVNDKLSVDPLVKQLFLPTETLPEATIEIDYLYDKSNYNELYHAIPEATLSLSNINYYFDTIINLKFGTGYFKDRNNENTRHEINGSIKKELLTIKNGLSIHNTLILYDYYYPSKSKWKRLYNKTSFSFPLLNFKNTVAYSKVLNNIGESPFIFDTINEITDDEINLESFLTINPLTVGVSSDYEINKKSFRNFKYTIGWMIHCWQFDTTINTVWKEISFGVSIPNLN